VELSFGWTVGVLLSSRKTVISATKPTFFGHEKILLPPFAAKQTGNRLADGIHEEV
jgi:hypothetical protein